MGNNIFEDKTKALLVKIGKNIREQRMQVFRESEDEFALRIAKTSNEPFSGETVKQLERGDPDSSTINLMRILLMMQVADNVAEATKSNASLYLAAVKQISGIEDEIRRGTPK